MNLRAAVMLIFTHTLVAVLGFGAGIYVLPILTAPPAPTEQALQQAASDGMFEAQFRRELEDSDALHWGEGVVTIGPQFISFTGELAPGPDYKLYLSPTFVETEAEFERLKADMVVVGDVKTFNNFIVEVPAGIEPSGYTTVIVWCESFGQFITAGQYR